MRGAIAVVLALAACGGAQKGARTVAGKGRSEKPHDKISASASKAFESAVRALHVGGPDSYDTAKGRFKDALKQDSSIWEAWYDLGVIAWKSGDDDESIDDFSKALALNPGHTQSLLARAEAHRRAGHKDKAQNDYETALKGMDDDDPNRRDTAARLASLFRDSGKYDEAVAVIRDTVRLSGTNAKIYTELAEVYIAQKRFELAQLLLAKAIEADPKDPAIYNALAVLAQRQGKSQEAFQRFDRAAELDPNYLDARFNKASILLDAGDYDRADKELTDIVQKRDDDYGAMVSLGVAQRGLKDFPGAKKTWSRVIKDAPRHSTARYDALYDLALLEIDFLQDADAGKADLAKYLQEAPDGHSKHGDAENKCKDIKCK